MGSVSTPGVPRQLPEIVERMGAVELAGVDQLTGQGREGHTPITWLVSQEPVGYGQLDGRLRAAGMPGVL
jgi:hypothetical protein